MGLKAIICCLLNFLFASMSIKVSKHVLCLSNSLDPDETPSFSASYLDPSCLHKYGTLIELGGLMVTCEYVTTSEKNGYWRDKRTGSDQTLRVLNVNLQKALFCFLHNSKTIYVQSNLDILNLWGLFFFKF